MKARHFSIIMVKCLIFDFDGTLADTNKGIVQTFRRAVEILGIPCPTDEEISATIGLPLKQNFLVAIPGISDEKADECVKTYREVFYETAIPCITAFPGVSETLAKLHAAGYGIFIATSRSRRSLNLISDNLGISGYYSGTCCVEDVNNPKPAPDMVEKILGEYGFQASETVVIGDTLFDLLMGKAAGCRVCGVTWGNHKREKLLEADPEFIIDKIEDIWDLTGSQNEK